MNVELLHTSRVHRLSPRRVIRGSHVHNMHYYQGGGAVKYGYHGNNTDQHFKEEPGMFEDSGFDTRLNDDPLQRQLLMEHLPQ